jgi:hypothetical protein
VEEFQSGEGDVGVVGGVGGWWDGGHGGSCAAREWLVSVRLETTESQRGTETHRGGIEGIVRGFVGKEKLWGEGGGI